jgi:uncharacterized damage-inducible protein DinB
VTKAELRLLLDYHYWARDRVLTAAERLSPEQYARDLGSSFPSIRDTLNHIYSAEWIWYSRWQGRSPSGPPAERLDDIEALRAAWQALEVKWRSYFDGLTDDDLARSMRYTLLNGTPGMSVLWQMMQHVINHASYHRGQVATMVRQLGAAPASPMDLIAFYRERQQAAG